TRLREAYSWVYRLVRKPPTWHSDLAVATEGGNLLGALAVGGPFAKLLERSATGGDYFIDLRHMYRYPVRDGLSRLGCRILFEERGGTLRIAAIERDDRCVSPADRDWDFVHRVALCSLLTH